MTEYLLKMLFINRYFTEALSKQ